MSAQPAQITKVHRRLGISAVPAHQTVGQQVRQAGFPHQVQQQVQPQRQPDSRVELMAERRAVQRVERQSRRRWAVGSCVALGASFALTAGILDVLH
jgi:hypothetical protein